MLERLPVGCQSLDLLLGGGFESGIITELYGESGSGKSNIVLQLAVAAVARGFRVIFIDTEGFSAERFKQIAGPGAAEMAAKIMIFEPMSLEQQAMAIREASKIAGRDLGLVILDSATSLYRMLLEAEDSRPARRALTVQLSELHFLLISPLFWTRTPLSFFPTQHRGDNLHSGHSLCPPFLPTP